MDPPGSWSEKYDTLSTPHEEDIRNLSSVEEELVSSVENHFLQLITQDEGNEGQESPAEDGIEQRCRLATRVTTLEFKKGTNSPPAGLSFVRSVRTGAVRHRRGEASVKPSQRLIFLSNPLTNVQKFRWAKPEGGRYPAPLEEAEEPSKSSVLSPLQSYSPDSMSSGSALLEVHERIPVVDRSRTPSVDGKAWGHERVVDSVEQGKERPSKSPGTSETPETQVPVEKDNESGVRLEEDRPNSHITNEAPAVLSARLQALPSFTTADACSSYVKSRLLESEDCEEWLVTSDTASSLDAPRTEPTMQALREYLRRNPTLQDAFVDRLFRALQLTIESVVDKLLRYPERVQGGESRGRNSPSSGIDPRIHRPYCNRCTVREKRLRRLRDLKRLDIELKVPASGRESISPAKVPGGQSTLEAEQPLAAAFRHCAYHICIEGGSTRLLCRPPIVPADDCGAADLAWLIAGQAFKRMILQAGGYLPSGAEQEAAGNKSQLKEPIWKAHLHPWLPRRSSVELCGPQSSEQCQSPPSDGKLDVPEAEEQAETPKEMRQRKLAQAQVSWQEHLNNVREQLCRQTVCSENQVPGLESLRLSRTQQSSSLLQSLPEESVISSVLEVEMTAAATLEEKLSGPKISRSSLPTVEVGSQESQESSSHQRSSEDPPTTSMIGWDLPDDLTSSMICPLNGSPRSLLVTDAEEKSNTMFFVKRAIQTASQM